MLHVLVHVYNYTKKYNQFIFMMSILDTTSFYIMDLHDKTFYAAVSLSLIHLQLLPYVYFYHYLFEKITLSIIKITAVTRTYHTQYP